MIFFGCSANINGDFTGKGHVQLKINAGLFPKITTLIKKLSSSANAAGDANLIDAASINKSLNKIKGIEKASLTNKTGALLEGQIIISDINVVVESVAPVRSVEVQFISWQQNANSGSTRIYLDKNNGERFVSLLGENLLDYLSALMAPIATGENITKLEYLELVKSVYGSDIANEISNSKIKMNLKFPAKINYIQGAKSKDDNAEFDIPLLDILVLENPLYYEVKW
jgi:hypothetical protein